jgi:hypothetical protein
MPFPCSWRPTTSCCTSTLRTLRLVGVHIRLWLWRLKCLLSGWCSGDSPSMGSPV